MSVHPINFNSDGSIDVICDETQHTGQLHFTDLLPVQNASGQPDFRYLSMPCPDGCGVQSAHPITGGASAKMVQEMFVRAIRRNGCPCGQLAANAPWVVIISHVRLHVAQIASLDVWQGTPNVV